MHPTVLRPELADPAETADAVGEKVGTVVPNGVLAAVVAALELLLFEAGTEVVEAGVAVVVVIDPGATVPGATVPGMTVNPDAPETVTDPPAAKPAVAQPHTVIRA